MNGLIDLYKPSGMSSAAAVARVKRILGQKRVGHMGTLDPMAEGVLVVGVGKSTRLFDLLCGREKTYVAKFTFGYQTDTLDALGNVERTTNDIPSVDAVLNSMTSLVGESEQMPPSYSAKHVDGKRAYAVARGGGEPILKPVRIKISDVQLIGQPRMNETVFEITCSAGTYIRAICRDVAVMCGSLATLTYLKRTRSGCFTADNAVTLEMLERGDFALVPPESVLSDLPVLTLPSERLQDVLLGRKIACDMRGEFTVYCDGIFFGVGRCVDGVLKIKTYLKDD